MCDITLRNRWVEEFVSSLCVRSVVKYAALGVGWMKGGANILIALLLWAPAIGQNQSREGNAVHLSFSPPDASCQLDRTWGVFMKVKESSPIEFTATLNNNQVSLPVGTVVAVNQRGKSWACVTGSVHTSKGWISRSGWMRTSQLEPIQRAK